jgi:hypothetical protein
MEFTYRKIRIIEGALNNTLDKLKATVRQSEELPGVDIVFQWFQQLSPIPLKEDAPPLDASDKVQLHFEAIFFFNGIKLYVEQKHEFTEHGGHLFLHVTNHDDILNDLDPNEYYDEVLIARIQKKFGLKLP